MAKQVRVLLRVVMSVPEDFNEKLKEGVDAEFTRLELDLMHQIGAQKVSIEDIEEIV